LHNHRRPQLLGFRVVVALALLGTPAATPGLEPPGGPDDWKYEVLHHKNGTAYKGLVVGEDARVIKFWQVKRLKGEPTRRFHYEWSRRDVKNIERLSQPERDRLWDRIKAINPDLRQKEQQKRFDNLYLEPVVWEIDKNRPGWSYHSIYFVLRSDADSDIVRRAALRLEQIYAAYANFLPPRHASVSANPTTILLVDSLAEYQEALKKRGRKLRNPAYYNPARNEVVCGSEFRSLGADLEKVRKVEQEWARQVADLKKRYPKRIPSLILDRIRRDQGQIERIDRDNDQVFKQASEDLFHILYHEAFHAYLETFVYPGREALVPYWLNEGLAQVFETAILEVDDSLRVGHVDEQRRMQLGSPLDNRKLVPLDRLLKAGAKEFQVVHDRPEKRADQYYLTSWALTFYVMIDKNLVSDRRKLDDYVFALKKGTDPATAFERLVGKPLPKFQKEFRTYLANLAKPRKSQASTRPR
jgi:hypothetical protein